MRASAGSVLIIVQNLPVPLDRRVWLEAKSLHKAGYRVTVICRKSAEFFRSTEMIEGIAVYRYLMPFEARGALGYVGEFFYAWMATALLSLRAYFSRGFQIIHACNPPDTYFLLALLYRPFGVRFVFDHHDLSPEMFMAKFPNKRGFFLRALYRLEKWTLASADVVLSTNFSYRQVALERGGKTPHEVFVVRTGPDLQRLRPRAPQPALKRGRPFLAAYLGEMCPQDGVDRLLQAIHYLVHQLQRRDISFVLVGGGPAQPEMVALSKRLDLGDFVHFTGRVPDAELCEILSTADVCVDPDPYTAWADSSTMNKIMEYMVFAKPIVAFDLTEHRFSAQEAAVYVQPNDVQKFAEAVAQLVDDEKQRLRMGRLGHQRVLSQLTWEYGRRNLLRAYRQVMADQAKQPIRKHRPTSDLPAAACLHEPTNRRPRSSVGVVEAAKDRQVA